MTLHVSPPHGDTISPQGILVDVTRCWRQARDSGNPVQPSLFDLLARSGDMLAPVFDSLLTLYEAALGRPVATGQAAALSEDETRLLGLMDGSRPLRSCIDCEDGPASALQCAICSTRIMIGLAVAGPAASPIYA